jgi:hypothetical protein
MRGIVQGRATLGVGRSRVAAAVEEVGEKRDDAPFDRRLGGNEDGRLSCKWEMELAPQASVASWAWSRGLQASQGASESERGTNYLPWMWTLSPPLGI